MIIYKTTNLVTGKIYVGQDSKNNPRYLGSGKYIVNVLNKYGRENFVKETLCECSSKEELNEKERYWIKELNSKIPDGYNLSIGGEGGDTFVNNPNKDLIREKHRKPQSEETKLKKRKPHGPLGEEFRRNCKIAQNRPEVLEKKRGPLSEEHKQKLRVPRGPLKEETKQKLRKPKGPMSEENKQKLRKPKSEKGRINIKLTRNRPEVLEKNRKPMSEKGKRNCKLAQNRPEVKEKHLPTGPRSEKAKRNMKLAQQKRRELEREIKKKNII